MVGTEVGYANGPDAAPTYEDVCRGSGHAETVKVEYNENAIDFGELVKYFFMIIDHISVNRQGNDVGVQYRTGIYYDDPEMLQTIQTAYDKEERKVGLPLAVELRQLENFFPAEEYHQKYLDKNPRGYCHIPRSYFEIEPR